MSFELEVLAAEKARRAKLGELELAGDSVASILLHQLICLEGELYQLDQIIRRVLGESP